MCIHECLHLPWACLWWLGKGVECPGIRVFVNCSVWMLGIEPKSSQEPHVLIKCGAILPALILSFLRYKLEWHLGDTDVISKVPFNTKIVGTLCFRRWTFDLQGQGLGSNFKHSQNMMPTWKEGELEPLIKNQLSLGTSLHFQCITYT